MKTIEFLLIITVTIFLLFLFINKTNSLILLNKEIYKDIERFYIGRYIIKLLTEAHPYASGICNLTTDFFNIFNESEFLEFLNRNNILFPMEIAAKNIYDGHEYKIGGYGIEYYEFRRICYYNGSLWLITVRV